MMDYNNVFEGLEKKGVVIQQQNGLLNYSAHILQANRNHRFQKVHSSLLQK